MNGTSAVLIVVYLVIVLLEVAAVWLVFTKAGQPGWASIIPIYNLVVWMRIAGRPGWWVILSFIPFVNFIVGIIVLFDVARSFGKGAGFAIGMLFLSFIFIPILGFGGSKYLGPGAGSNEPQIQPAV